MKPRREARLGPADAAALGPVALAGPGVQLVSDSDASHGPARLALAGPGREYNCRQRRLIPARPWVYLIRVTLVTVESSFNELLSGPWPAAVWPAALCFKCGVVLHEVRSRKLTQIKTVCFGFLKYISHRSHVPHRDHAASSGDCKSF